MNCIKCKKEIEESSIYCPYCGKKQTQTKKKYRKRANGTGTVYKLPGRRSCPWVAKKNGVYVGYYATEREATVALSQVVSKKLSSYYNCTFAEIFEYWKASHYPDITKGARVQYDVDYAIFKPLHNSIFRNLRTNDYQEILDQYSHLSENTVGKYKQLITQMSSWAIKNEIISVNFASFCKARGRAAKPHNPLTEEEIELIEKDNSETAWVILMMLATGMRISELFELPLENYCGTYCIGGEKSEEGRNRIIPIREEGRKYFALFADKAKQNGGTRLIDGYSGSKRVSNFRARDYKPLLKNLESI